MIDILSAVAQGLKRATQTGAPEPGQLYNYLAIAAINTFLETAAEQGWHMRPDEVTEEMDTAGSGWCWHDAPPKCWRDMTKAAPKFEWREEE